MLLFCDSFSHYDTSQVNEKYPPVFPDPATLVTIVPGAGRLGSQAAFFDAALGALDNLRRAVPTASPALTVGCAFRWATPLTTVTLFSIIANEASGDTE